jgi:hypothetical protein
MVEQRLESLGYGKIRRNMWLQKKQVVHIVHSSEFGRTCIVPVRDLFMSDFVKEKRQKISYVNSGYWWSQKFPLDHELGRLVLSFKERWDLLY